MFLLDLALWGLETFRKYWACFSRVRQNGWRSDETFQIISKDTGTNFRSASRGYCSTSSWGRCKRGSLRALCSGKRAALKRRSCWFHMTWSSRDNNASLVQYGIRRLWYNSAAKFIHTLTIRLLLLLLRYFSTSDKLRTDTFALGIITSSLWSVRSWRFFTSSSALV